MLIRFDSIQFHLIRFSWETPNEVNKTTTIIITPPTTTTTTLFPAFVNIKYFFFRSSVLCTVVVNVHCWQPILCKIAKKKIKLTATYNQTVQILCHPKHFISCEKDCVLAHHTHTLRPTNERISEWTNERMSEQMNKQTNKQLQSIWRIRVWFNLSAAFGGAVAVFCCYYCHHCWFYS